MSKHTPGPWKIEEGCFVSAEGFVIARIIGCDSKKNESNARLIAAAPELLEALESMLENWESGGISPYPIKQARAAISKATTI